MGNWSSKRIPPKYRYLQKQIDKVLSFIENLPEPDRDFSSLSSYERDLVEFLNGAMALAIRDQYEEEKKQGYTHSVIKLDAKLTDRYAAQYLKKEEIERAKILFKSCPNKIKAKKINQWYREPKNNLITFLSNQQNSYNWLPQGYLNYKNLRWVAWEELITLVRKNGYDVDNDDERNITKLDDWTVAEKNKIVHLYLEMINNEKITNRFNSQIDDSKKRYIIRERFFIYTR